MQPVGTLFLILRDLFHRESPEIDGRDRMSAKKGERKKEHSRTAARVEESVIAILTTGGRHPTYWTPQLH